MVFIVSWYRNGRQGGGNAESICSTRRSQNAPKTLPQRNLDFTALLGLTRGPIILLCTLPVNLFAVVYGASLASFYNAVDSFIKYTSHSHLWAPNFNRIPSIRFKNSTLGRPTFYVKVRYRHIACCCQSIVYVLRIPRSIRHLASYTPLAFGMCGVELSSSQPRVFFLLCQFV